MIPILRTDRRRRHRRTDLSVVLGVPSFRDGDPRLLAPMARHSDRLRLPPGRTLVRAGETARELIAIVAGEAIMLRPDGTVARLGAGDEIGGEEVVRNERHAATVIAASAVDVVVVNSPAVRWARHVGVAGSPEPVGRSLPADQIAA
jgi:hypothetical protein